MGLWADKTVLLVTHQLPLLKDPRVSRIIVVDQGHVLQDGTFHDLMAKEGECFHRLMSSLKITAPGADGQTKDDMATDQGETPFVDVVPQEEPKNPESKESRFQLTKVENRHKGAVAWATWRTYLSQCPTPFMTIMLLLFMMVEAVTVTQDWWLGTWAYHPHRSLNYSLAGTFLIAIAIMASAKESMFTVFSVKSASSLHNAAIHRVMYCPTMWFDSNPLGRILNRFSQDQNSLDMDLPTYFELLLGSFSKISAVLVLACVPQPWFILGMVPIVVAFRFVGEYYRRSGRETQRLYAITWSPVLSHLEQTLTGLTTIHAYKVSELESLIASNEAIITPSHSPLLTILTSP